MKDGKHHHSMWSTVNLKRRLGKKIEDCAVKIKSSIREKYTVVIVGVCALKQTFPVLYYSLYLVYIQRDFIPVQLACMCVFVYICVFY